MQKIDNILPATENGPAKSPYCGTARFRDVLFRKMHGVRKHGGTTLYCSNETYAREAGLSVRQVQRNKLKLGPVNTIARHQ